MSGKNTNFSNLIATFLEIKITYLAFFVFTQKLGIINEGKNVCTIVYTFNLVLRGLYTLP